MSASVIERAKTHLQAGEDDHARELLLREGFVRRDDPAIQRAYLQLIPPSDVVAEKVTEVLTSIADPNPATRYELLSTITREVFKEYSRFRKEWLAEPRISDLWVLALQDAEPKVVEKAAAILSVAVSRYFADLRAFDPLTELVTSTRKQTRLYAVFTMPHFARADRWLVLLPSFEDPDPAVRHTACRGVAFDTALSDVPASTRAALDRALRIALTDKATRPMAERALERLAS